MMMLVSKKPRRQDLWDALHMCTCSCRLRSEDYRTFQSWCRWHGKTVHEVVRIMVGLYMMTMGMKLSRELKADVIQFKKGQS